MPKPTILRFLYLYPNMMDLYGDSGNLQILKYRAEQRGIMVEIDRYIIGDEAPLRIYATPSSAKRPLNDPPFRSSLDFRDYDLVFLGGGSDKEQNLVAKDIIKYRKMLPQAYKDGVYILTICGGFQLFGKYYKDAENNLIEGVGLFDFYTESSTDKNQRCIGNIVIETELDGEPLKVVGFENHGGQTHGVKTPFGRVLAGNGNTFKNEFEGLMTENLLGTYLHGSLLSKNPRLSDYILTYCLSRHSKTAPKLAPLDDRLENTARDEMLAKLLSDRKPLAKDIFLNYLV